MSSSTNSLERRYGNPQRVVCDLPSIDFPPVNERKHGEVCMAILRRSGGFLLQTKQSYPNAVMRLPSGGIKASEDINHALMREVWEETNLDVHVERFIAILGYRDGSERSSFQSHLFLLREIGGELRSNDPSERITEWREAPPSELRDYAAALRRVEPSWNNWGHFRAVALDVLSEYCNAHGV